MSKLLIVGAGYVGLTNAVSFALQHNHSILVYDRDSSKINLLNASICTIQEPGVTGYIRSANKYTNKIKFVYNLTKELIQDIDLVLICVDAPTLTTGVDIQNIRSAVEYILELDYKNEFVIRTTVPPGTCHRLVRTYPNTKFIMHPEFLAQGTALDDFKNPAYRILGTSYADIEIYNKYCANKISILLYDEEYPVHVYEVAEAIKYAMNAYRAVKVTFANLIGSICEDFKADGAEVMRFVSTNSLADKCKYLKPGLPFGGSCLPKDVAALAGITQYSPFFQSVLDTNIAHGAHIVEAAAEEINTLPEDAHVLIYGASFKSDTGDTRGSLVIQLLEETLIEYRNCKISLADLDVLAQDLESLKDIYKLDSYQLQDITHFVKFKPFENPKHLPILDCTSYPIKKVNW